MSSVSKSIAVPYRPDQMLELVADIKTYPDFIPWIRSLRVRDEEFLPHGWKGRATAAVGFKGFSESFTTDVTKNVSNKSVDVQLVKGPFNYLENTWNFTERSDGCEIDFKIRFEFSNFILHALMKANFDRAVSTLIKVFVDEAEKRYGTATNPSIA